MFGLSVTRAHITEPRVLTLGGIGLLALASWLILIELSEANPAGILARLSELCGAIGGDVAPMDLPLLGMIWLLMASAMMLPTAAPTVELYVRLTARLEQHRFGHIAAFISGYLLAWTGFGVTAALAQVAIWSAIDSTSGMPATIIAIVLLAAAGAYQFSRLKTACLALCHNPMMFFMSRWREGLPGTLRLGFEHGVICIGCCWGLMLLMFATGSMNLLWMAALGLVMLIEKLLPDPVLSRRAIGASLLLAAAGLSAAAFG